MINNVNFTCITVNPGQVYPPLPHKIPLRIDNLNMNLLVVAATGMRNQQWIFYDNFCAFCQIQGFWVVGGCTYLLGITYSVMSGFLYYAQTFYCKGYLRIQEENIYPVQQVPVHPQECEDIFVQQLVYIPKK